MISITESPGCLLWIDGGGCWLLWFRDKLSWGGGASSSTSDYRLRWPAALRSEHAIWTREAGCDWLHPNGSCEINGEPATTARRLFDQDEVRLNQIVTTRWRHPSPLCESSSFSLEENRTLDHLDGVVLFEGACLVGPGNQTHIPCPHWKKRWIFYQSEGVLWGRMDDDKTAAASLPFAPMQSYQQEGWRFHFEPLKT